MSYKHKPSIIEKIAEKLRIIPNLHEKEQEIALPRLTEPGDLTKYPPPEQWDDWVEYEAKSWPKKDKKHYSIVPTTCFNCESACGLLSYVDKETNEIRKFEGNPYHPGSRGRNCAKGPATINQITDPDRILYPMKRKGKRGAGEWERTLGTKPSTKSLPKSARHCKKADTTKSPTTLVALVTKATPTESCKLGA